VALREVDDARADGGEAHERAGAGVPQFRVEALLLCTVIVHALAISLFRTEEEGCEANESIPGGSQAGTQQGNRERNAHLPLAAAARCWPRTTSSCPTTGRGNQNLISTTTTTPSPIHPPPPQIGRILQQVSHSLRQTREDTRGRGDTEGTGTPYLVRSAELGDRHHDSAV
jgi:hypothetical protein